MKVIDLRSDTVTLPTKEMLEYMISTSPSVMMGVQKKLKAKILPPPRQKHMLPRCSVERMPFM